MHAHPDNIFLSYKETSSETLIQPLLQYFFWTNLQTNHEFKSFKWQYFLTLYLYLLTGLIILTGGVAMQDIKWSFNPPTHSPYHNDLLNLYVGLMMTWECQ